MKKILDLWSKIENFLNSFLEKVGISITSSVKKSIPPKVKDQHQKLKTKVVEKKEQGKQLLQKNKEETAAQIQKIKDLNLKEKFAAKKEEVVTKLKETDRKQILGNIAALFLSLLKKIQLWFVSLQPKTMMMVLTAGALISVSFLGVMNTGQKIYDHQKAKNYIPPEEPPTNVRPKYYKRNEKYFSIDNLKVPILIRGPASLKSVNLDFTIYTSNRNIARYIRNNEHEVLDYIINNVHPILPNFPITYEGKEVIRDKVKLELNRLVRTKKIEGEVKSIYIHGLLGD